MAPRNLTKLAMAIAELSMVKIVHLLPLKRKAKSAKRKVKKMKRQLKDAKYHRKRTKRE